MKNLQRFTPKKAAQGAQPARGIDVIGFFTGGFAWAGYPTRPPAWAGLSAGF